MISWFYRKATKMWLKKYERGDLSSSTRAVFIGDYVSRNVILNEVYDAASLNFYVDILFSKLTHTAIALDIGANIGNHSCIFSTYFDRVIAFEPNPQVAALLRVNAMGKSIEVVEKGLSDIHGRLNFKICNSNLGGSKIVNYKSDIIVEVDTLDRLTNHLLLDNVSFIKIDVEGHEDKVLAGAIKLLDNQTPVLSLELHSHNLSESISKLLSQVGYNYFYLLVPDVENYIVPVRFIPKPLLKFANRVILKPINTLTECNGPGIIIVSPKPLIP